jgi:hypothetical protein
VEGPIPGCFGCAAPFPGFQIWVVHQLHALRPYASFMESKYGWPIAETLHFFGLTLLLGTIGMFDLRVLGMAKRIPIPFLNSLAPWGVAGFVLNAITGLMFLAIYPNQYIYNLPFLYKVVFIVLAGINALMFNLLALRKISHLAPGDDAPAIAKIFCGASLCLWIAVLFAGRLVAFFKPAFTLPAP